MRIRKSASRLLGSAYSASAASIVDAAPRFDLLSPSSYPAPCSVTESSSGPGFSSPSASSAEPCVLNCSPWDLIADLSLSDQKEEDELLDKYFVHVTPRASWRCSATIPTTSSTKKKKVPAAAYRDSTPLLRREGVKRAAVNKEESKTKMKVKVKKEEGKVNKEAGQDGAAPVWMCKKNDGRRWHCKRPVSQPNTLCEYHLMQRRSNLNPNFKFQPVVELEKAVPALAQAATSTSKSSTSSNKPQKKKPGNDCSVTEGFYYYAGFGPFWSKRQCRSGGGMNKPLPAAKKEEEKETPKDASHPSDEAAEVAEFTNQAVACQDVTSYDNDDIAGIASINEESSDDEYDRVVCNMDGTVNPQASNGEGKRKAPWKQWRKPIKKRSLKSFM